MTVNTDQYIKSVVDLIEDLDSRKLNLVYIWQEDDATCHMSRKSLAFLKTIFKDRIISRYARVELPEWPANSPDLNPLDFTFWGQCLQKVWAENPKTIADLKNVVKNFFESLSPDFAQNCVLNIRRQAELCVQKNGAHFEHLL